MRTFLFFLMFVFCYSNISTAEVVLNSDVNWGALNPARGDKGPRAANLWRDRTQAGSSGFLVKFVDGFSSPPHIHNVTYRGVVISGLVHNDDPYASEMWMGSGSYWTQPKGEVHITSAKGETNVVYVEIEEGPYLVHPVDQAFETEERPINMDASNVIWADIPNLSNIQKASLWGNSRDENLNGSFIKLSPGFSGKLVSGESGLRAIVIQGKLEHFLSHEANVSTLTAGSYFGSDVARMHEVACRDSEGCLVYIRTRGMYEVVAD